MARLAALAAGVVCVACGPRPERGAVAPGVARGDRLPVGHVVTPPVEPLSRRPVASGTGPHGANIDRIAISPDGAGAITRDVRGGVRLWPALDGSAEPWIVPVRDPLALSLARRGDGWRVGVVDAAGAAHVLQAGADGAFTERFATSPHVAHRELAVLDDGRALAVRADGSLALLGESGGELAVWRRRRFGIAAIRGVRGGAVAIAVTAREGVHAIELQRLAVATDGGDGGDGGERIVPVGSPVQVEVTAGHGPPRVAVSPDGRRAVALDSTSPQEHGFVVLDLETGARTAGDKLAFPAPPEPGFAGDRQIVLAGSQGPTWMVTPGATGALELHPRSGPTLAFSLADLPQAIGGGKRLAALGNWLYVQDFSRPHGIYLGYTASQLSGAALSPDGERVAWLAARGTILVETVGRPRERARALPSEVGSYASAALFADRERLLVFDSRGQARLIRIESGEVLAAADTGSHPGEISYEPSTRLVLAGRGGSELWLLEVDVEAPAFRGPWVVASGGALRGGLLASGRAGNRPAVWTFDEAWDYRRLSLPEVRAGVSRAALLARPDEVETPPSMPAVADRVGALYYAEIADSQTIAITIVAPGRAARVLRTPGSSLPQIVPAPDGSALALAHNGGLVQLFASAGADRTGHATPRWSRTFALDAPKLAWSHGGRRLAVAHGVGAAVLDAATGEVIHRRCGFAFEARLGPPPDPQARANQRALCEP